VLDITLRVLTRDAFFVGIEYASDGTAEWDFAADCFERVA
jgi:hypothetical protein